MSNRVPFREDDVREYLDEAIRQSRSAVEQARIPGHESGDRERLLIARCYVDAFQSVRVSLFGETLPGETYTERPSNAERKHHRANPAPPDEIGEPGA